MILIKISRPAQAKLLDYARVIQQRQEYEWGPFRDERKTPEKQMRELIFGALYQECQKVGGLVDHIDLMHLLSDNIEVQIK